MIFLYTHLRSVAFSGNTFLKNGRFFFQAQINAFTYIIGQSMIQSVKECCKIDKTVCLFHLINFCHIIYRLFVKNPLQNDLPQIYQLVFFRDRTDKTGNISGRSVP